MLAIGKIIPDSSELGSMVPSIAPSIAARCDDVRRRDQNAEGQRHHRVENALGEQQDYAAAKRHVKHEPRGEERRDHVREREAEVGQHLADDDLPGPQWRHQHISSVPRSFSRDSEIAVISAETSVSTSAISPGTKRFTLSSVGLKRMRISGIDLYRPTPLSAARLRRP